MNHQRFRPPSSFSTNKLRCLTGKRGWLTFGLFCFAIFSFTEFQLAQNGESYPFFSEDLVIASRRDHPATHSDEQSILPEKIITIIGKESSGTTFVSQTIAQSLGLPGRRKYRDGFFHQEQPAYNDLPVQVQHVSLPQGAWCLQNHSHHIVDVILPPHCVTGRDGKFPSETFPNIREQCKAFLTEDRIMNKTQLYEGMVEMHEPGYMSNRWENKFRYKAGRYPGRIVAQSELVRSQNVTILRQVHSTTSDNDGKPTQQQRRIDEWLNLLELHPLEELQDKNLLMYPNRFLLNITAQKLWYDAHGTEQVIVIVVRDSEMSLKSRLKEHCHILELAKEEEMIANTILNDAIQTFFLKNDKSGLFSHFGLGGRYGNEMTVEEIKQEALLWDPTRIIENKTVNGDPLYSSLIPAKNNVVLVSYEAMMKYEQDYVFELYRVLGIESSFKPVFRDGNAKYRNESKV